MPIYELRCTECHEVSEVFRKHSEFGQWPECECGGTNRQKISRPMAVHVDNMPIYKCPATGKGITSRKQRNETFARHGLMDANDLGPPPEVDMRPVSNTHVPGLGSGGNLDEKPAHMPKMSRRDEEQLTNDIKESIAELSQ